MNENPSSSPNSSASDKPTLNPAVFATSAELPQPPETKYVLHRRFDRMGRLVGDQAMAKLMNSHVMVIGLGGVGSWAAESLMRSGVGRLTVVDFDEICVTNANRQLHALQGLVGKKKALVMAERLRKINPQAQVKEIPLFYNKDTAEEIFSERPDYVIDAIDNLTAKTHLINLCREQGIPLITSGGAAARMNPLAVKIADLAETQVDPLCAQVRKILRTEYNFPRSGKFGVPCVYSNEETMTPMDLTYDKGEGFKCVCPQGQNNFHSCDKRRIIYGTASFVTGTFGLVLASHVVNELVKDLVKAPAPEVGF